MIISFNNIVTQSLQLRINAALTAGTESQKYCLDRGRPKKWPQRELFRISRLPPGGCPRTRAPCSGQSTSSLLSRQRRPLLAWPISDDRVATRPFSPRRARGRLQAPILVYLHPPSFPLISCRSIASATHSALSTAISSLLAPFAFCSPSPWSMVHTLVPLLCVVVRCLVEEGIEDRPKRRVL
jgi:hypothetical protein